MKSEIRNITLKEQVERDFLPFVRKPARYIGGEINQIKKDLSQCELTVALCFPDIYEIGMSYTGMAIIYDCLNKMETVAAERVFAPWLEAEEILRDKKIPLFSLESKVALKNFDIVSFSLTNELCYTNVLNMLDLGGINLRSNKRSESEPLIIAGGGQTNCCEPVAEFFDLFLLGQGEEAIVELAELVKEQKKLGKTKKEILSLTAEKFQWAYVPSIHKLKTKALKLKDAVVEDFSNANVPLAPIVPFVEAVHERISVEIMRGCPGRCRFCQASFCRRPISYRSVERIVEIAKVCYKATGFDTVSLLSLSTADYPQLEELTVKLHEYFADKYVGISLPSLRVDTQLKLLPKLVTSVRKGSITIAVEAASENLRKLINKPLKDEDLFAAVKAVYQAGWQKLKLYFMVGFPGETEEDIRQIVELANQLAKLRKDVCGQIGQINAAVSWLVPKPHTPFGWLGQKPKAYFERAKQIILEEKIKLRANSIRFKFHNIESSVLESAMARGDKNLCDVVEYAFKSGAKFDLWSECFDYGLWEKAFEKFGLNLEQAAEKQFAEDEILPWEHLGGPDKTYLLKHLNDAIKKL